MGKRGPPPSGKTTEVIRIKKTTRDAIRRLAADLGLSQSEVVDKAVQAYITLEQLWTIKICLNCKNEVTPEYGYCPLCGGKEFTEVESAMKEESK